MGAAHAREEICYAKQNDSDLTGAKVSSTLRRYKNRIIDGKTLKVDKDAGLKQVLFKIEKLSV